MSCPFYDRCPHAGDEEEDVCNQCDPGITCPWYQILEEEERKASYNQSSYNQLGTSEEEEKKIRKSLRRRERELLRKLGKYESRMEK
jgi:hypothetical protein